MISDMNTPTTNRTQIFRNRRLFEAHFNSLLGALNRLGPLALQDWGPSAVTAGVGDECRILHEATNKLMRQVESNYRAARRELPELSLDERKRLARLDRLLVSREFALSTWIQANIVTPRGRHVAGEWIQHQAPFGVTFELSDTLDTEYANRHGSLWVSHRFPSLKMRRHWFNRQRHVVEPPLFVFGKWSDLRTPEARVPLGLQSELLQAFLTQVPELAYFPDKVETCTVKLEGRIVWQFSVGRDGHTFTDHDPIAIGSAIGVQVGDEQDIACNDQTFRSQHSGS